MNEMEIVKRERHKAKLIRMSLRAALQCLEFTDEEMRFRQGAFTILSAWTGEEMDLLKLAHTKWRVLSRLHHEANGGDPETLTEINSAYASIKQKLKPYAPQVEQTCPICHRAFRASANSRKAVCDSRECRQKRASHYSAAYFRRIMEGKILNGAYKHCACGAVIRKESEQCRDCLWKNSPSAYTNCACGAKIRSGCKRCHRCKVQGITLRFAGDAGGALDTITSR